MEYIFLTFADDLIKKVIDNHPNQKVLYLFPNRNSAKLARQYFQQSWNLQPTDFQTMDQWITSFYHCEYPILKEEKRTLAFYFALTEDQKERLGISTYFQAIKAAHNFFRFWEEIHAEMIAISDIDSVLNSSNAEWQRELLDLYIEIKDTYYKSISDQHFCDSIFLSNEESAQLYTEYDRIVVVNQFYFSRQEKKMLAQFDNKVVIYYQIPETCIDQEKMLVIENFSAHCIAKHRNNELTIIETSGQLDMIANYLSTDNNHSEKITIDFRPDEQPYNHFINRDLVSGAIPSFQQSRTYIILEIIHRIIKNIVIDYQKSSENIQLIQWDYLLKLLNYKPFQDIISKEKEAEWLLFMQDYHKLQESNFLYLDIDGTFLQYVRWSNDSAWIMRKVLKFIRRFLKIDSIIKLCNETTTGIMLSVINEDNNDNSDFARILLQALTDFQAIESCGLAVKWQQLTPGNKEITTVSANLLKLLLDYLKPKTLPTHSTEDNQSIITFSSLHDQRNTLHNEIVFLNTVEGFLPPPPVKPILLTENQRKQLGLKTYDDIKLREKYYFLRTIATTNNVTIYTYTNLNQNVERSSFLEEVILSKQFNINYRRELDAVKMAEFLMQTFAECEDPTLPKREKTKDLNFYNIPFLAEQDLADNKLPLTGYSSNELINNPIAYYLRFLMGIKPRISNLNLDFSEKIIGQISHDAFQYIWKRLFEVYEGNRMHHNFLFTNENYADRALEHLTGQPIFRYMKPHNYSEIYFKHIFLPVMKEGIKYFFYALHNDLNLSDSMLEILSEFKEVIEIQPEEIKDTGLILAMSGRADLIIKHETRIMIFDYKTGKDSDAKNRKNFNQLEFYKYVLSRLDNSSVQQFMQIYLYYIEEMKLVFAPSKKKQDEENQFEQELFGTISRIAKEGFGPSEKRDTSITAAISRWDLFEQKGQDDGSI